MKSRTSTAADMRPFNPFWSAVCGRRFVEATPPIDDDDLAGATREAFRHPPCRYGLRHPVELVDLEGRFRHFVFGGRSFVAKRSSRESALREAWQARLAKRALRRTPWLTPLVPAVMPDDPADTRILVAEDSGDSLAGSPGEVAVRMPWEALLATVETLLDHGVVWSGFLPRNVLPGPEGHLTLIDWEDCRFDGRPHRTRAVGQLTLLFWSIGWAGHYGIAAERFQEQLVADLGLTLLEDPLDRFERAYAAMLPLDVEPGEIRRRCSAATIATEAGHPSLVPALEPEPTSAVPLSAADIGHLLDELLPVHLSVLYTFACKALLDRGDVARYRYAVELVNRALVLGTPYEGIETATVRRRLQVLVLLAVVAAVLDNVEVDVGLSASDASGLVRELCDGSSLAAELCPTALDPRTRSHGVPRPSDEAMSRLVSVAAVQLGVAGGPFHVADGVAVYDDSGALATLGLRALCRETVQLFTGQARPSHRQAVQIARGT